MLSLTIDSHRQSKKYLMLLELLRLMIRETTSTACWMASKDQLLFQRTIKLAIETRRIWDFKKTIKFLTTRLHQQVQIDCSLSLTKLGLKVSCLAFHSSHLLIQTLSRITISRSRSASLKSQTQIKAIETSRTCLSNKKDWTSSRRHFWIR